jgi:hypothetical protein
MVSYLTQTLKFGTVFVINMHVYSIHYLCIIYSFNPLTSELNPSAQRCVTRIFYWNFASLTVHFVNTCVKNQQIHQLFIQFINYVW